MCAPSLLSSAKLKAEASRLGFIATGIVRAESIETARAAQWREYLAAGRQAAMSYLERNLALRLDPRLLVEGAKTFVSLAMPYAANQPIPSGEYTLSRYALGDDYHDVMRARLRALMEKLGLESPADGRAFCDTAPVDERYWARRAGVGRVGRSGLLFVAGAGSFVFLGELILTREVDHYDPPVPLSESGPEAHCGACHRCQQQCPGCALDGMGLNARRCLSYLTIEHQGELPSTAGAQLGGSIYGCDRCAEVCPHNRNAATSPPAPLAPRPALLAMRRADWHNLTPETYRALFKGSAVKRAKWEGLVRNIRAARGGEEKG